jgi:hypothetical protein
MPDLVHLGLEEGYMLLAKFLYRHRRYRQYHLAKSSRSSTHALEVLIEFPPFLAPTIGTCEILARFDDPLTYFYLIHRSNHSSV